MCCLIGESRFLERILDAWSVVAAAIIVVVDVAATAVVVVVVGVAVVVVAVGASAGIGVAIASLLPTVLLLVLLVVVVVPLIHVHAIGHHAPPHVVAGHHHSCAELIPAVGPVHKVLRLLLLARHPHELGQLGPGGHRVRVRDRFGQSRGRGVRGAALRWEGGAIRARDVGQVERIIDEDRALAEQLVLEGEPGVLSQERSQVLPVCVVSASSSCCG
mmetsp:Transcript_3070/g.7444  ORF Transcript_3070/g.7444 Transcript_3070/m.7444 type:complete len:217 (+) Transcript_3070:162-812(+)